MRHGNLSGSRLVPALLACVVGTACGASGSGGNPPSSGPSGDASAGATTDAGGDGASTAPGPEGGAADGDPSSSSSSSGGSSGGSPAGDSGSGGDGAIASAPTLPSPSGACPTFANGNVTFSPAGIPARQAQVYMSDAAKTKHGPLILYWYATGSSTAEVAYSLGATLTSVEAAGGIVVAPMADPSAGQFEWFLVNGSPKMDDFAVADEIVACAAKNTAIDTTHIHVMGMSAGGLQTSAMSFLRSAYVASVTTYSGGTPPGFAQTNEDPANKFAALIFDGGSTDDVFGVDFQSASQTYQTTLKSAGHFAAICDHGMGHAIPVAAAPSVALFFQANGYGTYPSPYANGLPASFPSYCTL